MVAEDIIIKPIITERSTTYSSEKKRKKNPDVKKNTMKYTFKVNKKATKVDVKNAVQKLFGVKVIDVTTMIVKGSTKTRNGKSYKTADWKKAIVTVATEISPVTYKTKGGKEVKTSKKFNTEIKEFGI